MAAWCLSREHRQLEPLHEGRRDLQPARGCWLRLLAAVVSLCSLAEIPSLLLLLLALSRTELTRSSSRGSAATAQLRQRGGRQLAPLP